MPSLPVIHIYHLSQVSWILVNYYKHKKRNFPAESNTQVGITYGKGSLHSAFCRSHSLGICLFYSMSYKQFSVLLWWPFCNRKCSHIICLHSLSLQILTLLYVFSQNILQSIYKLLFTNFPFYYRATHSNIKR